MRSMSPSLVMPALLTSMSICPNSARILSTVACVSAKSAALEAYARAFTPRASISLTVSSITLTSVKAMSAPSEANLRAMALPIPLDALVISATLPWRNPIILFCVHSCLHFVRSDRKHPGPYAARSALCHKHVIFQPYPAEIEVVLKFIIIYMALVCAVFFPLFNQGGYEVYARLIRDHIARYESASHTQAAQSKLRRALLVVIVAHEILSEVFHVVNVEAHVVTESVRHEQPRDSVFHPFVNVPAHKVQLPEIVKHMRCNSKVDIEIWNTRLDEAERKFIALIHSLIYLALLI